MSDLEFSISGTIPASRKEAFLAAILEAMEEQPSVPQIAAGTYTPKASSPPVEPELTIDIAVEMALRNSFVRHFANLKFVPAEGEGGSPAMIKGDVTETGKKTIVAVYNTGGKYVIPISWKDQTITVTSTATVTQEQHDTFFSVFEKV